MRLNSNWMIVAFALSASVAPTIARASEQVGTLAQLDGTVQIFADPSKKVSEGAKGDGSLALFEGEYFRVRSAKAGDRIENGFILRTAPGAKARVIYDNGDQINVGPATAYRIHWEAKNPEVQVRLMYGKVRGVVEKGGPRSHLRIQTRSATMGVRGTDFYIEDDGIGGGTSVSILRGEVAVAQNGNTTPPMLVKAGFTADVPSTAVEAPLPGTTGSKTLPAAPPVPAPPRATSRQELKEILQTSKVQAPAPAELKVLERKAIDTAIRDIQKTDPQLYAQVSLSKIANIDVLNAKAVEKLIPQAPQAAPKTRRKPRQDELEEGSRDAYERYFKPAE